MLRELDFQTEEIQIIKKEKLGFCSGIFQTWSGRWLGFSGRSGFLEKYHSRPGPGSGEL